MKRLAHKNEQLLSAFSMVPGIFLALYWANTTKEWKVVMSAYTYIIACIGSIAYHTYNAYNEGYNPKMLRLDITSQQLMVYVSTVLSPVGACGTVLILPLTVLLGLIDLKHINGYYLAIIAHAVAILTTTYVLNGRLAIQWLIAFAIYAVKDRDEEYYTVCQSLWHVLCHVNMNTLWHLY
jgi:hypothetical protein